MAEQNFNQAIKIADRGYIIVHGEIEFTAESAEELANNEMIKQYYLGVWRCVGLIPLFNTAWTDSQFELIWFFVL